jgi:Flp pilus assembly protein TadG
MSRSERGSVAVEIVIIVPLMIFLLLGFSAIYFYIRTQSAIEHTAFTLASSLGQMTQISSSNAATTPNSLGSLWYAATVLAAPYPIADNGGVFITSICDMSGGNCVSKTPPTMTAGTPRIVWQAKAPWTKSTMVSQVSSNAPLPANWPFRNSDTALIVEIFYTYDPFSFVRAIWAGAPGVQTTYRRVYVRPRSGQPVYAPS